MGTHQKSRIKQQDKNHENENLKKYLSSVFQIKTSSNIFRSDSNTLKPCESINNIQLHKLHFLEKKNKHICVLIGELQLLKAFFVELQKYEKGQKSQESSNVI